MKLISRLVLAAFFAASLTACGGFSSGLPKGKAMNELTAAEAKQFCEKVEDYFEKQIDEDLFEKVICYSFAVAFAEMMSPTDPPAGCQAFYDDCMEPEEGENGAEDACADAEVPPCTGTVGEYELCVEEMVEMWSTYIQDANSALSYTCSEADMETDIEWLDDPENDYDEPQSCKDFENTCDYEAE